VATQAQEVHGQYVLGSPNHFRYTKATAISDRRFGGCLGSSALDWSRLSEGLGGLLRQNLSSPWVRSIPLDRGPGTRRQVEGVIRTNHRAGGHTANHDTRSQCDVIEYLQGVGADGQCDGRCGEQLVEDGLA